MLLQLEQLLAAILVAEVQQLWLELQLANCARALAVVQFLGIAS